VEGRVAVIRNFTGRKSAADFVRSDP
jgi:hypothetical protein